MKTITGKISIIGENNRLDGGRTRKDVGRKLSNKKLGNKVLKRFVEEVNYYLFRDDDAAYGINNNFKISNKFDGSSIGNRNRGRRSLVEELINSGQRTGPPKLFKSLKDLFKKFAFISSIFINLFFLFIFPIM